MNLETKLEILEEIKNHVEIFKPVPPVRYRIRCPFCGDSSKDPRDTHMYIKCSKDPDEPLLYKCFLANCQAEGRVDANFLERLGITHKFDDAFKNQRYNKLGMIKKSNIEIITGKPVMGSPQIKYIEDRLGKGLSQDDYDRFKIIWDMSTIIPYISDRRVLNTLPSNRDTISFLSDDRSSLISRSFDSDGKWRKIKLFPSDNKSVYITKTLIDLFSKDDLEVNIAEGIFDILSVYKNFGDRNNGIFVAVLGGDYISGVEYALKKGFIGSNINVRIYVDDNINIPLLKKKLKKYKWLFKSIVISRNAIGKDVGVRIEDIELVDFKV